MNLVKKILLATGGFLLFLFTCLLVVQQADEWMELNRQKKEHPITGSIYTYEIQRGLFGEMHYYADILTENGLTDEMSELSKKQFEAYPDQREIEGYWIGGSFYTDLDVRTSVTVHVVLLFFFGLYPFFYTLHQLTKLRRLREWKDFVIDRIVPVVTFGPLLVGFAYVYYMMGQAAFDYYVSHKGEMVEQQVVILDGIEEHNRGTGRHRISTSAYWVGFNYYTPDEELVYMRKEVPANQFENSGFLTIQYPKDHPYHVTVPGFGWRDFLSALQTAEALMFGAVLLLTGLLLYIVIWMRWKRRRK